MIDYRSKTLVVCVVLALSAAGARGADSPYLYGIHWWGYTQGQTPDNGPCQMLDCGTHGGWTVETSITHSADWWKPSYFAPLYTELYNNRKMSIISRIDYDWGQTVPAPTNPNYNSWPSSVVNAVNTLRHGSHIWIIGNEPNLTIEASGWPNNRITPQGYATIYRNVRTAIKNQAQASPAGPHIVLIAAPSPGGPAGERWMDGNQYLGQVIDNIPAAEIDGIALHAYGTVNEFRSSYTSQLALIDSKNLRHVPVYITEWNVSSTEQVMAQAVRDCYADLNTWNAGSGHHNVICLCWFIYDADQQAGGSWNSRSIEYYKNNGLPYGNPGDLYTAFEQTVDLRYPAGKVGTVGLTQMTRSPASFTRSVNAEDNLPSDTFTIQRTGGTTAMAYTITDNASWLSVSPSSGSSSGEVDTIAINYQTAALAVGSYTGTITITADSASNSPQTIAVNLTVKPSPYAPVDFDKDGDVDQEDFGRFQVCYTGSGVPQTNTACAKAKLDADSDVDLDDYGLFQRCLTGPNQPASPTCAQ